MPLYSVQRYVHGLIDGLPMPQGIPGPLVAWITPPVAETIKAPRAYVWGGTLRASRQSAPRGAGLKKRPWIIDVYLSYMDSPRNAMQNEPAAKVIDAVTAVFETTTMPVWIDSEGVPVGPNAASTTDSQIQAIGETWALSYAPEKTVLSQRQLWYTSLISLDVLEVLQR